MDTNNNNDLTILSAVNVASHDSLADMSSNTTKVLSEQFSQNVASMSGNERFNIALDKTVNSNGLATQSAIERNGHSNIDTTYRTSGDLSVSIEKTGMDEINTIERLNSNFQSSIERTSGDIETSEERIASETRVKLSRNNTAAALLGKDILLDIKDKSNEVTLQASKLYNKTELKLQEVESLLKLESVHDTNDINFKALKLKADLQVESTVYCCELKNVVNDTSYATNKINRGIEYMRMRDELEAATMENLFRNMCNN